MAFEFRIVAVLAASAACLPSCKCQNDRPYTPFRIDPPPSVTASATGGAAPPVLSAAPGDALPRLATAAPKDASRFEVDGVPVATEPERVIELALAADFDGDGTKDAIAWTRARADPPDTESSGELSFFGGTSPAGRVIGKMYPFVPSGPGCKHTVVLAQTGPRTVLLDVSATCESALVPRSPVRGVSILAPAADRPEIVTLRLASAAPGEALKVSADSSDRDGDGRDDVRFVFTLGTEGTDEVSADLVWLDRAAGRARDASEPAKSLGTFGTGEAAKPPSKTPSAKLPGRVANARRLYATLCAESGTARVFDADGEALPCTDAGPKLNGLLDAEVRAAVTRKDLLGAVAALGRDGFYHAKLSEKARAALEKLVLAATTSRAATERAVAATPRARSGLPRYSPLTYDADGSLLVQTEGGIVRVRAGQAEDASEAADPWPLTVGGSAEPRWMGIAFPCDRSEILLVLSDPAGTPLPSRPTSLVAPRPGACRARGPVPAPDVAPLEWSATRQAGWVGGGLFGASGVAELSAPAQRGTPRSSDGKTVVLPWSKGLLVVAGGKAETWTVPAWPALTDCVIANGGAAAACVRGDRATTFEPEPLPAKPAKAKKP